MIIVKKQGQFPCKIQKASIIIIKQIFQIQTFINSNKLGRIIIETLVPTFNNMEVR